MISDYIPVGQPMFSDLEPYHPYQSTLAIPEDFHWNFLARERVTIPERLVSSAYACCLACTSKYCPTTESLDYHDTYCVGKKPLPKEFINRYYD